jgi:hypothetical protein
LNRDAAWSAVDAPSNLHTVNVAINRSFGRGRIVTSSAGARGPRVIRIG